MVTIQSVIAGISVFMAAVFGYSTFRRGNNADVEQKAVETATINVKLDNIGSDVKDIKYDISAVKKEQQQMCERMIVVEQSIKSAHHRLDTLEEREKKNE